MIHLLPAVYHSDPTTADGCLVVTDWGEDLVEIVAAASGMATDIYPGPYRWLGIEGMFLEVFVSRKT